MEKIIIGKEYVDPELIETGVPTTIKIYNRLVTDVLIKQSTDRMVRTQLNDKWFNVLNLKAASKISSRRSKGNKLK